MNNIGIAEGTVIETAIGGSGNDIFEANGSRDTPEGGRGIDTYSFGISGWGVANVVDVDLSGRVIFTGVSSLSGLFAGALSGSNFVLTYQPTGSQVILQGVSSPNDWTLGYTSAAVPTATNWTAIAYGTLAMPDLVVASITPNAPSVMQGASFGFSYVIQNIGAGPAGMSWAGIFLDQQTTTLPMGWNQIGLNPNASATATYSFSTYRWPAYAVG